MAKRKINAVYPGVIVKATDEETVKAQLGASHWNPGVYKRYCNGLQSGTVMRMVGTTLALVKFVHCDGLASSLTFPIATLIRCDEHAPQQPSIYAFDNTLKHTPCVVCGSTSSFGQERSSGFKCSTCIGTRTRFRFFGKARKA
eukprot:TRINITY_DN1625_c1_g1_i1.p1 TRINITY_DN1625_c1_g1~~TRINITY_DN1625_c1_g1_i1.p1  ORF type:complete len:156 (+),score=19.31 TRINITY_DN1625_c1_g1_i1:42-470(+)